MDKNKFKQTLGLLIERELNKQQTDKKPEPVLKDPKKQTSSKLPDPTSNVSIGGKPYKLTLDVNKNPTKKGLKIQFMPEKETESSLDPTKKRDLQIELLKNLNEGLKAHGLEADIDPDVPYLNVIGLYIRLQFFDKLIREILTNGTKSSTNQGDEFSKEFGQEINKKDPTP